MLETMHYTTALSENLLSLHDGARIRPFRIDVSEKAIVDLLRRLASTRWPDRTTVLDQSRGPQLEKIEDLVLYWQSRYDWRKAEAKLNALPQFVTEIDGVDIQFAHIHSRHPNAMPLIMTHGWPGSMFELLKVVGPLTDPTAYGGCAEDAFELVLPSLPGYGFSGKPCGSGWDVAHIAHAWDELMWRLGYSHYVSQGGGWGAVVSEMMAAQAPAGLLGIHMNVPAVVPPDIADAIRSGDLAPAGMSSDERAAFASLKGLYGKGDGCSAMMNTHPQTLAFGLADSPVGLAAWLYDKLAAWTYNDGDTERSLTQDELLDDITLYWLTNTGASSSRLYCEASCSEHFNAVEIAKPVAVTVFSREILHAPRSWAERSYHNLIYWNQARGGGHFAVWEEPQLFANEVRAAFRPLRM